MQLITRRFVTAALAASAGVFALPLLPALAQTSSGSSDSGGFTDLVPVMIWTTVIALLTLGVATIGYMYRRDRGMDTPLPDPMMIDDEHGDPHRDAAGNIVPEHAIAAHARGLHDDSTEQAERLVEREEPAKAGH
jgi:hypothetical protein